VELRKIPGRIPGEGLLENNFWKDTRKKFNRYQAGDQTRELALLLFPGFSEKDDLKPESVIPWSGSAW